MIILVDYGMGNIRSIQKHFNKMGLPSQFSSNPKVIEKADKLILPGVGHYKSGMKNLIAYGLIDVLNQKVMRDKVPILGICLGMQLFTKWGEEGETKGLGWIEGNTKKFSFSFEQNQLKIPHIGWNSLYMKNNHLLFNNIKQDDLFYFVHSYHVVCEDESQILAKTLYGYKFVSVLQQDNIFGTQFHPEKSHDAGKQVIKNFLEIG